MLEGLCAGSWVLSGGIVGVLEGKVRGGVGAECAFEGLQPD